MTVVKYKFVGQSKFFHADGMAHARIYLFLYGGIHSFQCFHGLMNPRHWNMRIRVAASDEDRRRTEIPFIILRIQFVADEPAGESDNTSPPSSTISPTSDRAEDSHGSFCFGGARKEYGYHV